MTTAYPLTWPESWPRSRDRKTSQFKTSLEGAIKNVEKSLQLFATDSGKKVESLLVSSNFQLMQRKPADPGVAVYFTWDGISTCIAVDRYLKLEDNLQAIHHCIEAERTKLRHGGINLVRASFRGFAALPPPSPADDWRAVFALPDNASLAQAEIAYKLAAKIYHPDSGSKPDATMMAKVNAAIAAARKELK